MKTILAQSTLAVVVIVGLGVAQQASKEKHVRDIRAEQSQKTIAASALCQQVRDSGKAIVHRREVNPGLLETNLLTLMRNSDEVILASLFTDQMDALAPSRDDVIEYYDVRVLRSWKGTHTPGDLV